MSTISSSEMLPSSEVSKVQKDDGIFKDASSMSGSFRPSGDDVTVSTDFSVVSVGSGSLQKDDYSGSGSVRGSFNTRQGKKLVRKSSRESARLSELSVNKLQFARLGKLYGRDRECSQIQDCWGAVRAASASSSPGEASSANESSPAGGKPKNVRRFVTIAGASGTGKSSLVVTLEPMVQRQGGFFLQGKFPQQHRLSRQSVEPYAAFVEACTDLCHTVISLCTPGNPHKGLTFSTAEFRERLDQELGVDARILTRVIPALHQILKVDPSSESEGVSDSIGYREAHHQFKQAFRRFIRVVTTFGPVVLVLDDLQWADVASMELLEALVTDRESTAFLAVGCYRDDEMYSAMPHLKTIESLLVAAAQDPSLGIDQISVGTLDITQVNELMVDLLSSSESDTLGFAECVHKKTLGNIFFVIQFLTLLQDSELLVFNFGSMKWTWDLNVIQTSTAATENVVILMQNKMKTLPQSVQQVLPILACLGSTFSVSVLLIIVSHSASLWDCEAIEESFEAIPIDAKTAQLLSRCEQDGLIESCREARDSYRWVHDKIQEAAFSLLSDMELHNLKLKVGKILYEGFSPIEMEKHLFTVANLLCTENPPEWSLPCQLPIEVAQLYLRAGTKTMENSAFDQAAGYLLTGIGLLPDDHWQSQYGLSLDLYSAAAEADFCTGNFDRMRTYCDAVIRQDNKPLIDKKRVYTVLIDSVAAELRFSDSLDICRSILAKLGCRFPHWGASMHTIVGIVRLKLTLKKHMSKEKIAMLPPMDDEVQLWTMSMIDKFVTSAYLSKLELLPLGIFKGFHETIQKGVSYISPVMFSLVGLSLAAFVQDYKAGVECATQAIELLKTVKSARKVESRVLFVCHAFVLHWLQPITLSIKPLLTCYEVGMTMGDTESASWGIYYSLEYSFRTGANLSSLAADCEFYADQLREVKQLKLQILYLWQCVQMLRGDDPFDGLLSGSIIQQEKVLESVMNTKDYDHQFCAIYRIQMYLAFVFNKHQIVYESIKKTNMDKGFYEKIFPGLVGSCHLYAFNGLSMISLYRETRDRKYLSMAKKFASKIRTLTLAGVSPRRISCIVCEIQT